MSDTRSGRLGLWLLALASLVLVVAVAALVGYVIIDFWRRLPAPSSAGGDDRERPPAASQVESGRPPLDNGPIKLKTNESAPEIVAATPPSARQARSTLRASLEGELAGHLGAVLDAEFL